MMFSPRLITSFFISSLMLAGCSGDSPGSAVESAGAPSGQYVAELAGSELGTALGVDKMHLDFKSNGTAVLEIEQNGRRMSFLDCTVAAGEVRIALSCPGSSGISLTRLQGGDLEGDMDGAIVRYRKR